MKKTKDSIIFMIILMSMILITPTISQAALQSNGDTAVTYTIDQWIWQVREMQGAGGTLGLTDTMEYENEDKYLTSNNPNLDIHMEKNTEYGAMAILSASSYGNPNPIANGETTTGNSTGVTINFNNEWVSAGCSELGSRFVNFAKAVGRYKNIYTLTYEAKAGDAIKETQRWHGTKLPTWLKTANVDGLARGNNDSVFMYQATRQWDSYQNKFSARRLGTRAVVVVGTGI